MGIMLITEVSDTLTQDMTNRNRLGIAKKLQLLVQFITKLKRDSFHPRKARSRREANTAMEQLI